MCVWYSMNVCVKILYQNNQKPSSRVGLTEKRLESTSKGPDQRRRISVKDNPGSTSWIYGRDSPDGRDGRDEGFIVGS